jgi:hypothetical protein
MAGRKNLMKRAVKPKDVKEVFDNIRNSIHGPRKFLSLTS